MHYENLLQKYVVSVWGKMASFLHCFEIISEFRGVYVTNSETAFNEYFHLLDTTVYPLF